MSNLTATDLMVDYGRTDPEARAVADAQARRLLDEHGCFVARGLLGDAALEPMRRAIRQLIELRMRQFGLSPAADDPRFDAGLWTLKEMDRRHRDVVISAMPYLAPFHEMIVHPELLRLSRVLMATEAVLVNTAHAVRIHWPHEDYLLPWHQDYPYIQDSEDGVVYWIPLRDVAEGSGALKVALGSHRAGVRTIRGEGPRDAHGHRALRLACPAVVGEFPQLSVPTRAGDVLVFSTLILHASGGNRSGQISWGLQIRHGNFAHPKALAREWPVARMRFVPFGQSHPEYYVDGPESELPT